MTRNTFLLPVILTAVGMSAQAQTYYGNGYTIVEGGLSTGDDLDAKVFKTISAYNVEEGLHQLLQGSGWTLAGYASADPGIWRLYQQPYPDNKRTISPMGLADALQWIAGDGWELVVDRVNRLISFEVSVRYAPVPVPVAAKPAVLAPAVENTLTPSHFAETPAFPVQDITRSPVEKLEPLPAPDSPSYDFANFISNTQPGSKATPRKRKGGKS